jgi:hypothetical protein
LLFQVSKTLLATALENISDRFSCRSFNPLIGIDPFAFQTPGKATGDGRLSRTTKSDQIELAGSARLHAADSITGKFRATRPLICCRPQGICLTIPDWLALDIMPSGVTISL